MMLLILIRIRRGAARLLALVWLHRTSAAVGLRSQVAQAADIEEVTPHMVCASVQIAMVRLGHLIKEPCPSVTVHNSCCLQEPQNERAKQAVMADLYRMVLVIIVAGPAPS
jgi:hypothetical protein